MLQRMVEAKAIVQENRQLKATLQLREHERERRRRRADRRLVVQQPAPLRDPVGGTQRRRPRSACRCARPTGWSAGSSTPARSPRACCSSPTAPTSSRRGCCAAASRSSRRAAATARSTSARSRSAATRSSAATSSSPPGTGGLYPPLVPIARVVKLDDDGAIALPLADPANTSFAIVEPPFEPAAVAAEIDRRRRRRPDGPRGARPAGTGIGRGPAPYAPYVPAATVVARVAARRAADRLDQRLVSRFRLPGADQLAPASRRSVAGLVGGAARPRQRPVHRLSR